MNPSTTVWKGDGYQAILKQLLETIRIEDYNRNILYKEYFFEDKEWIQDMTDGLELLEALKVQAAALAETQKNLQASATKAKK